MSVNHREPDPRPRTLVLHQFPGMGDLVWHVPYIRAVAAQSHGGQVAVISAPSTFARELLSGEDCVSEVIDFDRRPRRDERRKGRHAGVLGMFRMGRELRPRRFDRIIIFSDHANRALMALTAGIPERIGYGFTKLERLLLSHGPYIRNYRGSSVAVYKNASTLAVSHGFCPAPVVPKLHLPPQVIQDQEPCLAGLPRPLYTFAIGSSERYKQWGAENFAALANALTWRGCGIVLLGGPAEAALAEAILRDIEPSRRGQVRAATGNTMLQSAATLALAEANIGNDTGISNLAAALNRPSFVLLGNRPLLDHDPLMLMLLTPDPQIPASARVLQPPVRLDQITVADVLARLEDHGAPGFGAADARPTGVPSYLDFRGLSLAERLACTWWAQHRHRRTGEQFGLIDDPAASPDLAAGFPQTFRPLTEADLPSGGWVRWHPGPVWLTARNAFARQPVPGAFEQLPLAARQIAQDLQAAAGGRRRVLIDLADAAARQALGDALAGWGLMPVDVQAVMATPDATMRLLGEMLAAAAWVGDESGRDHLWALLRPEAPQISVCADHAAEEAHWAVVQRGLGLPQAWSPLPFHPALQVVRSTGSILDPNTLASVLAQLRIRLALP